MPLSPEDQRVLSAIENELAAAEPLLDRALATMRLLPWHRIPAESRPRTRFACHGWFILIFASLAAGVALLWAGMIFQIPEVTTPSAALAVIVPLGLGRLARWLVHRRAARATSPPSRRVAGTD